MSTIREMRNIREKRTMGGQIHITNTQQALRSHGADHELTVLRDKRQTFLFRGIQVSSHSGPTRLSSLGSHQRPLCLYAVISLLFLANFASPVIPSASLRPVLRNLRHTGSPLPQFFPKSYSCEEVLTPEMLREGHSNGLMSAPLSGSCWFGLTLACYHRGTQGHSSIPQLAKKEQQNKLGLVALICS